MKELQEAQKTVNGFNTEQLSGLIENLKEHPEAGNVDFRCHTRWQDGARAFHHFSGYSIDGQRVHDNTRKFVVLSDEPSEFGVTDAAPAPAEQLLGAVAGCVTTTTNAFASLNGVNLTGLKVDVHGIINLQGMFALREDVPVGFKNIEVNVSISGDAPESKLREMAEAGFTYSPIRNTISHSTSAELNIQSESTE